MFPNSLGLIQVLLARVNGIIESFLKSNIEILDTSITSRRIPQKYINNRCQNLHKIFLRCELLKNYFSEI